MKILLFDIETSPMLVWSWGLFNQNHSIGQIHTDWKVLCWAAKWLDEESVYYSTLWEEESEQVVLEKLWDMLNEADVVVGHNGKRFDVAKINAKFFEYGMDPTSPFKVVDTLQTVRRVFKLSSNKLDYVASLKGYGHKLNTNFQLWLDVISGDKKQCKKMLEYNIHDVELLEDVYKELLPWDNKHPIPQGELQCRCGSHNIKKDGTTRLAAGKYQTYKCRDCGAWLRGSANLLTAEERKGTLRSIT